MVGKAFMVSLLLVSCMVPPGFAQTAQVGGDAKARASDKLRIEYVHFRPARWETEHVQEFESEHPNRGGLVYVYYTNISDAPLDLRYWRLNGNDESYWRLNHFVAWDRAWHGTLAPGRLGVLEINGITPGFAEGEPFDFSYIDGTWRPVAAFKGILGEDPVQIACIRVLPGLDAIEVHIRYAGETPIAFESLEVVDKPPAAVEWTTQRLEGPGHTIARARFDAPFETAALFVVRATVKTGEDSRAVYAHRRAFEDFFPIGTWTNSPETFDALHRLHIDTMVAGGNKEAPFFAEAAPKYGFRAMVHTGVPVNVDTVREFSGHPSVVCWMLQDEPDWSIPANIMEFVDRTLRQYDRTEPTFITLCRNIKFFEYAPIPDIACQDHYSVTAPSSSKWPRLYGTRLEETAYYTRDLKRAAEPKPIWIWTQGIADWTQRPKRTVPTPEELAAQLVLNLGRGAKGILWFNHDREIAERFPDAVEAMQGWGRVLRMAREDFLASEPVALDIEAPEKTDVAPLVTWDALILCVTNLDYEIHPEAYPFVEKTDARIAVPLPAWIKPATALRLAPDGVRPIAFEVADGHARVTLDALRDCAVLVLHNDPEAAARYDAAYREAVAIE